MVGSETDRLRDRLPAEFAEEERPLSKSTKIRLLCPLNYPLQRRNRAPRWGSGLESAGMELVEVAKATGERTAAYRLGDDHEVLAELEAALRADETAWKNFQNFSNTDQYGFIAAVGEAKTDETRQKRIERTVKLAAQDLRAYDKSNKWRL
jgi:hypothetical protein